MLVMGLMDKNFETMQLPDAPDVIAPGVIAPGVIAPDGSDVRILLQLGRGSIAPGFSDVAH
jgi:hypothetical protein